MSVPAELYSARRTLIREASSALLHLLPGDAIYLLPAEDEDF